MSKQSTEDLIAEARERRTNHPTQTSDGPLIDRLADRLEEVAKDSAEGQYQHAYWQKRAEDAEADRADIISSYEAAIKAAETQARDERTHLANRMGAKLAEVAEERDALAAVVEKVRAIIAETCCGEDTMCEHDEHIWADFYGEKVSDIDIAISVPPADALREVKAEAWDEAVETTLNHAIRNPDGVTLRMEKSNPYRQKREEKS